MFGFFFFVDEDGCPVRSLSAK